MNEKIEELKAEASKLGYILVKKREFVPLLPCPCGAISKTKLIYSTDWSMFYRCSKCNFEGYRADTKYEARENWNRAVKINGEAKAD